MWNGAGSWSTGLRTRREQGHRVGPRHRGRRRQERCSWIPSGTTNLAILGGNLPRSFGGENAHTK